MALAMTMTVAMTMTMRMVMIESAPVFVCSHRNVDKKILLTLHSRESCLWDPGCDMVIFFMTMRIPSRHITPNHKAYLAIVFH